MRARIGHRRSPWPSRSGRTRRGSLTSSTRGRPIASSGTAQGGTLQGYSFDQAKVQTGDDRRSPGRGPCSSTLRARAGGSGRIDPRTELPESLRATRPDTDPGLRIPRRALRPRALSVEPAPPRLRVAARTTVTVDPRSARGSTPGSIAGRRKGEALRGQGRPAQRARVRRGRARPRWSNRCRSSRSTPRCHLHARARGRPPSRRSRSRSRHQAREADAFADRPERLGRDRPVRSRSSCRTSGPIGRFDGRAGLDSPS